MIVPYYIWIIIIGAAAAVTIGGVVAIRSRRERRRIVADLVKLDQNESKTEKDTDWSKVAEAARKRQENVRVEAEAKVAPAAPDAGKWAAIRTGASTKVEAAQPATGRGAYWQGELGELMAKAAELEEKGNFTETLRVLEIAERVAKQTQNQQAFEVTRQKIKDLWVKINDGN
jgi:hypothetical protein